MKKLILLLILIQPLSGCVQLLVYAVSKDSTAKNIVIRKAEYQECYINKYGKPMNQSELTALDALADDSVFDFMDALHEICPTVESISF